MKNQSHLKKKGISPFSNIKSRMQSFKINTRWLFLIPAVIYIFGMFAYPIIRSFILSLQEYSIESIGTGDAPFIGLANYIELFSTKTSWSIMLNTFIFVIGSIFFQLVIGMIFALFFDKKFPLNNLIRTMLLIPWLLPLIVSGTAFKWIFDESHGVLNFLLLKLNIINEPLGWLTTNLSLVSTIITNIWVGIPFCMVLFYSGLQDIPKELHEAGKIDGGNAWQRFWHITIPSLRSVITVVVVLALIYTLKVFDIVKVLTDGGPSQSSEILATWSYNLSFEQLNFGSGNAVAIIMVVISLAFAYLHARLNRSE